MPFPGKTFTVTSNEQTLGPGKVTVLEGSFLFEANDHRHVGFDLSTMRLMRVMSIYNFEVAYSLQGSIQRVSVSITPRYIRKNEGIEKDITTNPLDWEISFWKLHTITGAVVARTLADRAGVQVEGLMPMKNDEFEGIIRQAINSISNLPSNEERGINAAAKLEVEKLEQLLSDVLLKLTDAWIMGNLSTEQRVKVASLHYFDLTKRHELGWSLVDEETGLVNMSNQDYKDTADDWFKEESQWGSDIKAPLVA